MAGDAHPSEPTPTGGEGEGLSIRGSSRRLLRRVLASKLRAAQDGTYDDARRELVGYANDPTTSRSEKRKALEALLRDEADGVAAAKAVLGEASVNIDARSQTIALDAGAVRALADLQGSPEGRAALTAGVARLVGGGSKA